jgi:hypothetical protein
MQKMPKKDDGDGKRNEVNFDIIFHDPFWDIILHRALKISDEIAQKIIRWKKAKFFKKIYLWIIFNVPTKMDYTILKIEQDIIKECYSHPYTVIIKNGMGNS